MKINPLPIAVPTSIRALHLQKTETADKPKNPLEQYAGIRPSRHSLPLEDQVATATLGSTFPLGKPPEVPICTAGPGRHSLKEASAQAMDEPPEPPICTGGPSRHRITKASVDILS